MVGCLKFGDFVNQQCIHMYAPGTAYEVINFGSYDVYFLSIIKVNTDSKDEWKH
jgi:hypothetical protein